VKAGEYRFQRDNKPVVQRTDAYDLRLFRDGKLVAQLPGGADALLSEPTQGDLSGASLKAWQTAHAVPLENRTFHNIRLPHSAVGRQVEFSAYAFNSDRVKGETTRRVYTSRPLAPSTPRAYIITMGVSAYQDSNWDLWFAAEGAKQMRDFAGRALNEGNRYKVVPITLLAEYDKDGAGIREKSATKAGLRHAIDLLAGRAKDPRGEIRSATPDDLVFLYIASHGYAAPDGRFYIVPFDVGEPAGITEKVLDRSLRKELPWSQAAAATAFLAHSISSEELTAWLYEVDAGEMILILDSCHSAEVAGRDFKPGPLGDRGFGQLAYDKQMRVLAATQADNIAVGPKTLNQSLLTYALLHPAIPEFHLREWLAQAEEQVPELYRKYYPEGKAQQPILYDLLRGAGEVK
jgi:hypothetical protein